MIGQVMLKIDNRYRPSKQLTFKTWMLLSDLCHFSDAYTVVKGTVTVKQTIMSIKEISLWL